MKLELADEEKEVIRNALEIYLSDLRAEIVRTEKHEWKIGLRKERGVLEETIEKLQVPA